MPTDKGMGTEFKEITKVDWLRRSRKMTVVVKVGIRESIVVPTVARRSEGCMLEILLIQMIKNRDIRIKRVF